MPEKTETIPARAIRVGDVIYYGATKLRVDSVQTIPQRVPPGGTYRNVVYPNGLDLLPAYALGTTLLHHPDTAAVVKMNIGPNPDLIVQGTETFERVIVRSGPRTYTVGLPVIITVDDEFGVSAEVDYSDVVEGMAEDVNDDDSLLRESFLREDQRRVLAWARENFA